MYSHDGHERVIIFRFQSIRTLKPTAPMRMKYQLLSRQERNRQLSAHVRVMSAEH